MYTNSEKVYRIYQNFALLHSFISSSTQYIYKLLVLKDSSL